MTDIQTNSTLKYGLEKTSLQASPNKETMLPLIQEPNDHPSQRSLFMFEKVITSP